MPILNCTTNTKTDKRNQFQILKFIIYTITFLSLTYNYVEKKYLNFLVN